MMNQMNLKQRVIELEYVWSREAFNVVDELFTIVLNKARSVVEGLN